LKLVGGLIIKAFNGRDLVALHIGNLFHRREAFGRQKLADHFIDIERVDEQIGSFGELFLATVGFFILGHDVDVPAGQLRGQPNILPAATDRKGQLVFRHDNFNTPRVFIEHNFGNFSRLQARSPGRSLRPVTRE
jgi:hypothetical protein